MEVKKQLEEAVLAEPVNLPVQHTGPPIEQL